MWPCHRKFPRRPRLHAVAWFPWRLWAPFPPTGVLASRSPRTTCSEAASFRQLHLLRSLVPPANPFALVWVAPPQRPLLSWVFAPPELSPFAPRVLSPARTTSVRTRPSPEGSGSRPRGPLDPQRRVRPPLHLRAESPSSAVSGPLRDRPAPPLGDAPTPSTLVTTGEPAAPWPSEP
jgi:hypothetical protein